MALYAFDGTWNSDEETPDQDTNVVKFLDYCSAPPGHEEYIPGVGTRFGLLGKMVGGLMGAGGHERVQEMVEKFDANWKEGDKKVDVIGFSRGSALALDFCNRLAAGVTADGQTVRPEIRFLGLWDTVAAFGAPGLIFEKAQETNMGHKLTVPKNVQHCFHAMALDERRGAFMITRLDPEHDDTGRITEVWFRGVHSDVGGGNENVARSNIALGWMIENAITTGLPIDRSKLATLKAEIDPFHATGGDPKSHRAHPVRYRGIRFGRRMTILRTTALATVSGIYGR